MGIGYAKVKQRTGGLANALAPVFDYFEKKRKEKEQKKFYDDILKLYNDYYKRLEEPPIRINEDEITWEKIPMPKESQEVQTNQKDTASNLKIPKPELNIPLDTDLEYAILPDAKPISGQDRYDYSLKIQDEFIRSMLPYIFKPDLNEEQLKRANLLAELINKAVERHKPQTQHFILGSGDTLYSYDKKTNKVIPIAEGKDKEPLWDIEMPLYNKNTGTVWVYDKILGKFIDTGLTGSEYMKQSGSGERSRSGKGGSGDEEDYTSNYWQLIEGIKKLQDEFRIGDGGWSTQVIDGKTYYIPPITSDYYKTKTETTIDEKGRAFQEERVVPYTLEEYKNLKEQVKREYVKKAEKMIADAGLQKIKKQIDDLIKEFDRRHQYRKKDYSYYENRKNMRNAAIEGAKRKYNLSDEQADVLNVYYELYSK